jgi:hypothetical protein
MGKLGRGARVCEMGAESNGGSDKRVRGGLVEDDEVPDRWGPPISGSTAAQRVPFQARGLAGPGLASAPGPKRRPRPLPLFFETKFSFSILNSEMVLLANKIA